MTQPLNYAELYLQGLQQKFSQGLFFNALYNTPNNQRIRWVNAKTVQIPRIDVTGMVDVDRDSIGTYARKVDNSWETKTLQHDREFRTLVDPVDIDETNMAATIANITRVFNDEQKIPEMDKYMASKLYAEFVSYGGVADTTALSEQNVLQVYDHFMEEMDEAEVPQEGRILYVTPPVYTMLKNAEQMQRFIQVTSNNGVVDRAVRSLENVQVVSVPSARMKTAYDFTEGAVEVAGADQINMILIHPLSIISPLKYEFVSLDQPSATTGGKYLYYERSYWDVFAIERKVPGIKFNITPAA
jgi:hypothetical protein